MFVLSIGGTNNFVDINFDVQNSMRIFVCEFINQPLETQKECSINITYGENCEQQLNFFNTVGTGSAISSPPLELLSEVIEYCFSATAKSGNLTVTVEGTLNLFETNIVGKLHCL